MWGLCCLPQGLFASLPQVRAFERSCRKDSSLLCLLQGFLPLRLPQEQLWTAAGMFCGAPFGKP